MGTVTFKEYKKAERYLFVTTLLVYSSKPQSQNFDIFCKLLSFSSHIMRIPWYDKINVRLMRLSR